MKLWGKTPPKIHHAWTWELLPTVPQSSTEFGWNRSYHGLLCLRSYLSPHLSYKKDKNVPHFLQPLFSTVCCTQPRKATITERNLPQENHTSPNPLEQHNSSSLVLSEVPNVNGFHRMSRYLWNFRPILPVWAWSRNAVQPQAALALFHSTGPLCRRPSLKLLTVPNCPLWRC